jgi:hypothetical protein
MNNALLRFFLTILPTEAPNFRQRRHRDRAYGPSLALGVTAPPGAISGDFPAAHSILGSPRAPILGSVADGCRSADLSHPVLTVLILSDSSLSKRIRDIACWTAQSRAKNARIQFSSRK